MKNQTRAPEAPETETPPPELPDEIEEFEP